MYLGRESINAKSVPVYGTGRLHGYLAANGPWSQLVTLENIEPRELVPGMPLELDGGLRITALSVPHRDEFSDTVGYLIDGPNQKALFIPDIDQWQKWSRNIRTLADQVDILAARRDLRVGERNPRPHDRRHSSSTHAGDPRVAQGLARGALVHSLEPHEPADSGLRMW